MMKITSLIASLLIGLGTMAQTKALSTAGTATLSDKYQIVLDESMSLQPEYVSDIASLSFASEEEAVKFFNGYENNIVSFELDYPAGEVHIFIHSDRIPEKAWEATDWNDYLQTKAEQHYTVMSK